MVLLISYVIYLYPIVNFNLNIEIVYREKVLPKLTNKKFQLEDYLHNVVWLIGYIFFLFEKRKNQRKTFLKYNITIDINLLKIGI